MSALLLKLGVDPHQLRVLLRLAWRNDMRSSRMSFGMNQESKRPIFSLISSLLFYLIAGVVAAFFIFKVGAGFQGALFMTVLIFLMLGGLILVEYNTVILSPEDYHILGYMPISSRTFFFARIGNMLLYLLLFSAIIAGPSIIALALLHNDFFLPVLIAATLAVFGAAVFIGLSMVYLYGLLLNLLPPHRLKSLLSFLQFALSMAIYTSYLFLPNFAANTTGALAIELNGYFLLFPPAWFAALVDIPVNGASTINLAAVALGVFSTGVLLRGLLSRISITYAGSMAALSEGSADRAEPAEQRSASRPVSLRIFRSHGARVVTRLTIAQFRYDNRFRLSVIGFLPLILIYFYMGLQKGNFPDPFIGQGIGLENFSVLYFAILMLPLIMKQNMEMSDASEASWIFYATPVNLAELILATRNILFLIFAGPALLLIFGIFLYFFQNGLHATLHILTITLLNFIMLQVIYLIKPRLPFAEPKVRSSQSKSLTFLFFFLPAIGLGLLYFITRIAYDSAAKLLLLYVLLFALIALLEKLTHLRISAIAGKLHFDGKSS